MSSTSGRALAAFLLTAVMVGCAAVHPPQERVAAPASATSDVARADSVLSDSSPRTRPELLGAASDRLILLLAFGSAGESVAADIERSFRHALRVTSPAVSGETVRAESPYETALACDTLMQPRPPALIVFAGDEGCAAVVTLMSAEYRVPVLKITADGRSCSFLSDFLFEFLPSAQEQADALGEYAARRLGLSSAVILAPNDASGRALADGFANGAERANGVVDTTVSYSPLATNIRPDLATVFSSAARAGHGRVKLGTVLTPEERTEAFGDAQRGDVLFSGAESDSAAEQRIQSGEGFFFALSPFKVDAYASQLPTLPRSTVLLGNSSWADLEALAGNSTATEGMYLAAPMLPEPSDSNAVLLSYLQGAPRSVNEWELLGLDAGTYVGQLLFACESSGQDVFHTMARMGRFSGIAAEVDFAGTHQNRAVRILQYQDGELHTVR